MQKNICLSLILPSFNEGESLPNSIETLYHYLQDVTDSFEIIISDDGSTDHTLYLDWEHYKLKRNVLYLRSESNLGKGNALRNGFSVAKGKVVLFMDADLPIDLSVISDIMKMLSSGSVDIVYGDRKSTLSTIIGSGTLRRKISSKAVNIFVRLLLLPEILDTQCPVKGFNCHILDNLNKLSVVDGYSTDIELLYLARCQKVRMKNIPVRWHDLRAKPSLFSTLKTLLLFYRDIIQIRVRRYHPVAWH